ncbi:hypothetical protein JCM3770_003363 [Rhodotorula araucariae]
MFSVVVLALTYLAGGLTFLPLCAACIFAVLFYTSPVVHVPRKTGVPPVVAKGADDAEPVSVYRAGWLTVRRTYEPMKGGNGDGTYAGMLASSYRSFMDQRSRDPRRSKPKDRFFAVLKQKTLFLYEGEDQGECWAAIDVAAHDIVIFPEGNVDGELYVKRTAIELKPRKVGTGDAEKGAAASPVVGETRSDDAVYDSETGNPLLWFIFAKVNSDKEDWYHSLVLSSRLGYPDAQAAIAQDRALFEPADMARLMEQIDQQPDSIPMRWFNALLGRVFLTAYRTSTLEDYLTSRIVRKLKRVKTPAMLSEIQVREVNVGASAPLFSKPMLKELTADGDASMEVHVAYVGGMRVTIETEATVSLGSRFKPYSVRLVLAVVLRELEGTLLVKMKQPPSNRIWFGFREIPRMALSVEPVVSTRQIKWSLVTGPIESRIRELIAESLVLPHMDDLSFFDTRAAPHSRGGIYGPFLRRERPSAEEELDGPSRPEREVVADDAGEELAPGADAATSTATPVEGEAPRQRKPEARRRRSSEGDHPLDLTPMPASPAPSVSATPIATPGAKGATPITSASSSSVASLATGLSASLASWREKNAANSTGSSASSTVGAEGRRKTSWFAKSSSSASSSLAEKLGRGESSDSLASSNTATTSTTATEGGASAESTPQEEVSAAKLREILTKRAESREREKERERATAAAAVRKVDEGDTGAEKQPAEAQQAAPSNLSLTAPADADANKVPPPTPSTVTVAEDAPLPLIDPMANSPPPASSPSKVPSLPSRTSLVKTLPDPPPVSSSPPAPAPISHLAQQFPALPARRHSPSASVDSGAGTSTLLSTWRTRATDKEALAAGVASAKESMRRWGATWAAKRAAAQAGGRPEDLDRPVGESPAKERDDAAGDREAYRDYRARAASPAGRVGGRGDVPRTPPRGAVPGFKPAQSSLPAVQLSPSHALSASPTKPSGIAGAGGYRPVQMMALPGIKDEERRRMVREDHLGGGATAGTTDASRDSEADAVEQPAADITAAEQARRSAVEAAAVVPPTPVTVIAPAEPPSTTDEQSEDVFDVSVLGGSPLDSPVLPSQPHKQGADAPPPLPPRKDEAEEAAHEEKTGPPALPPRPGDRVPPPPFPPRESVQEEDETDEAGWGLDDSPSASE